MSYDVSLDAIKYLATVPKTSYLAIGYGAGMMDIDMAAWLSNRAPSQEDLYSTGYNKPKQLSSNAYTTTIDSDNSTFTVFTSTRSM